MRPEDCKEMVRAFYNNLWDRQDRATCDRIIAPDLQFRGSLGPVLKGRDAFWGYVQDVTDAVGEYHSEIRALIAEDDRAFAQMTFYGNHQGNFMEFEPTLDRIWWDGAGYFQFQKGRIADLWVLGDVHGLLSRLSENAKGGAG